MTQTASDSHFIVEQKNRYRDRLLEQALSFEQRGLCWDRPSA